MNDPRLPRLAYFALALFGILSWTRQYPLLPDRIAVHFNAANVATGWSSKSSFFTFMTAIVFLLALSAVLIPRLITSIDPGKVNLPNKYFWLAPENSAATRRFLGTQMGWFTCGLLALLLYANSKLIEANLPGGRFDGSSFSISIFLFIAFTFLWSILILRHFSRLPE